MNTNPDNHPRRVLVVDDDPVAREVASAWLDELGYRTACAGSAGDAMARLDESDFDVLFADVHLRDTIDGFQLSVAAVGRQSRIRAMFVSAQAWGLHQSKDPGTTFLHKPYSKAELARALNVILAD